MELHNITDFTLAETLDCGQAFRWKENPDGSFSGAAYGKLVTLTLDGQEYQCVFVETNDEAGNPTMCFSACGSNNETVWGVHYLLPDCSS